MTPDQHHVEAERLLELTVTEAGGVEADHRARGIVAHAQVHATLATLEVDEVTIAATADRSRDDAIRAAAQLIAGWPLAPGFAQNIAGALWQGGHLK